MVREVQKCLAATVLCSGGVRSCDGDALVVIPECCFRRGGHDWFAAGAVRKWRCYSRRREVRELCSCGVMQWWPARFRCVWSYCCVMALLRTPARLAAKVAAAVEVDGGG